MFLYLSLSFFFPTDVWRCYTPIGGTKKDSRKYSFFPPYCPPPANILPHTPPLVIYRTSCGLNQLSSLLLSYFYISNFHWTWHNSFFSSLALFTFFNCLHTSFEATFDCLSFERDWGRLEKCAGPFNSSEQGKKKKNKTQTQNKLSVC